MLIYSCSRGCKKWISKEINAEHEYMNISFPLINLLQSLMSLYSTTTLNIIFTPPPLNVNNIILYSKPMYYNTENPKLQYTTSLHVKSQSRRASPLRGKTACQVKKISSTCGEQQGSSATKWVKQCSSLFLQHNLRMLLFGLFPFLHRLI